MNKNQLIDKYPYIDFSKMRAISVKPGWEHLVECMLSAINSHAKQSEDVHQIPILLLQIKEKFGSLRVYYQGTNDSAIEGIVKMAEQMSTRTCDVCGSPGVIRDDLGWIRSLCEHHYQEIKNSFE